MLTFNFKQLQVNKGVGLGSKQFVAAADEKLTDGCVNYWDVYITKYSAVAFSLLFLLILNNHFR